MAFELHHGSIQQYPSQHTVLGDHQSASETPFKWRFAGVPMVAPFKYYSGHMVNDI